MRSTYLLLVAVLLGTATSGARACDFCSCLYGINPFYSSTDRISLAVLLQRSALDINTAHSGNITKGTGAQLLHGGHDDSATSFSEWRTTFEISAQHHLSDVWMVTLAVPVLLAGRTTGLAAGSDEHAVQGMGDPSVMVHYVATASAGTTSRLMLLAGVGVDLPLGTSSRVDARGERLDPHLQPGSGSADVLGNLRAMLQTGEWTFAFDALGRMNTTNTYGDRMGNSLGLAAMVTRDILRSNADGFALVGIAGARGEMIGRDRTRGSIEAASGSTTLYAQLGGEIIYGDVRANASVMLPLADQRPVAAGTEQPRVVLGATMMFGQ